MTSSFDVESALHGSAVGGLAAVLAIAVFTNIHHVYSKPTPPTQTEFLPEPCHRGLEADLQNLGCESHLPLQSRPEVDEAVYLVRTYIRCWPYPNRQLPNWWWTTHWAIRVRDVYFEIRSHERDRSGERPEGFQVYATPAAKFEERHGDCFKVETLMGYTHISSQDILAIGRQHAENYAWDPFAKNCQTFLHEAYFGKPLLSPLGKKREVRCRLHGSLKPVPSFTLIFLGSLMGLVYMLEWAIEWFFMLPLSPTVLLLRLLPVAIGLSSLAPRMFFYVKFICAQQDAGIACVGIGEKLSSWLIGGVRWVVSGFRNRSNQSIVLA